MNQRQALREAARHISVYPQGDNFVISYPWKDSDRRGPCTTTSVRYWGDALRKQALFKAELALWIYCEDGDTMPEKWYEFYNDACFEMSYQADNPSCHTARELLKIGIDEIRRLIERDNEAQAECEAGT